MDIKKLKKFVNNYRKYELGGATAQLEQLQLELDQMVRSGEMTQAEATEIYESRKNDIQSGLLSTQPLATKMSGVQYDGTQENVAPTITNNTNPEEQQGIGSRFMDEASPFINLAGTAFTANSMDPGNTAKETLTQGTVGGALTGLSQGGILGGILGAATGFAGAGSSLENRDLHERRGREDYLRNSTVQPGYVQGYGEHGGYFEVNEMETVPIQTELDEMLLLPDMSLVKSAAKEKHVDMEDEDITDTVPNGTYVFSDSDKMKLKPKDVQDEVVGGGNSFYTETESYEIDEMKMKDALGNSGKKITYADAAKKVQNYLKVIEDSKDPIIEITNAENLKARTPYLAKLIELQEKQRGEDENSMATQLINPEKFEKGGKVKKKADRYFLGGLIGALGSLGTASQGAMAADMVHKNTAPVRENTNDQSYKLAETGQYILPGQGSQGVTNQYGLQTNNPAIRAFQDGGILLDDSFLDDFFNYGRGQLDNQRNVIEQETATSMDEANRLNRRLRGINTGNTLGSTALIAGQQFTPDYFRENFEAGAFEGAPVAAIQQQKDAAFQRAIATGASPEAALLAANQIGQRAYESQLELDRRRAAEQNRVRNANQQRRVGFETTRAEEYNDKLSNLSRILNSDARIRSSLATSAVNNKRKIRQQRLENLMRVTQSDIDLRTKALEKDLGLEIAQRELDQAEKANETVNQIQIGGGDEVGVDGANTEAQQTSTDVSSSNTGPEGAVEDADYVDPSVDGVTTPAAAGQETKEQVGDEGADAGGTMQDRKAAIGRMKMQMGAQDVDIMAPPVETPNVQDSTGTPPPRVNPGGTDVNEIAESQEADIFEGPESNTQYRKVGEYYYVKPQGSTDWNVVRPGDEAYDNIDQSFKTFMAENPEAVDSTGQEQPRVIPPDDTDFIQDSTGQPQPRVIPQGDTNLQGPIEELPTVEVTGEDGRTPREQRVPQVTGAPERELPNVDIETPRETQTTEPLEGTTPQVTGAPEREIPEVNIEVPPREQEQINTSAESGESFDGGGNWDYRKSGDDFYVKRKGTNDWTKVTPEDESYNALMDAYNTQTNKVSERPEDDALTTPFDAFDDFDETLPEEPTDIAGPGREEHVKSIEDELPPKEGTTDTTEEFDEDEFLDDFTDTMGEFEGTEDHDAQEGQFTYGYGILPDTARAYGVDPDAYEGDRKGMAREVFKKMMNKVKEDNPELNFDKLPKNIKKGILSFYMNLGSLTAANTFKKHLKNGDYEKAAKSLKLYTALEDEKDGKMYSSTGLSVRRAKEHNTMSDTKVAKVEVEGDRENPEFVWYDKDGNEITRYASPYPLHEDSTLTTQKL